jgi:penicillin-binding protein 1B
VYLSSGALRFRPGAWLRRHPGILWSAVGILLIAIGTTAFFYNKYAALVGERLAHGSLRTGSSIYAAPKMLAPGDKLSPSELVAQLQRAGYTDRADNKIGYYRHTASGLEITTGPESYYQPHTVDVHFAGDRVDRINSRTDGRDTDRYWLEPELVTNVLDEGRGKRRPVPFSEFPDHLVNAVVSVEDKRFFNHGGLDILRVAKAAYIDVKEGRKEQGASTLTMQLARSFWLDQDKNWGRKFAEVLIASELERRFTKEEIFELYANEVYLGRRGSFSVHGFGEAARTYFGKDVRELTLPEAATLAGIVQRPSYYNPFKFPERVKQRRDLVLTMMHNNGHIDAQGLATATAAPLEVRPGEMESTDAPYFVDLVNEDLQSRFPDSALAQNAYRIYSTLDLDLQHAALEAVAAAMPAVDKAAKRAGGKNVQGKVPQVALIALDPHTGAIKALLGGRNYDKSQLNRVLAKRPPGSTFKPFVYATGLNLGIRNGIITAGTAVIDEPTIFMFNDEPYEPANFGGEYNGSVTVRKAVMNSLNIPTIKVAEMIGYRNVVQVARAAGITTPLHATPSIALGAYTVPPIELAEAYTIFANEGTHVKRHWITTIRDGKNRSVFRHTPETNQVLDPRAAYIMTNILEDVVRAGTAAAVRGRGFAEPAAGKTGTAHDGWFAGFTNNLLAVVWVGYDDYTELGLEGAKSALPIWTEFMKRAHALRQYAKPKPFKAPPGLVRVEIDAETGLLPGDSCLDVRSELFVAGTQPKEQCTSEQHYYFPEDIPTEAVTYEPQPKRRTFAGRVLDIFR